MSKFEYLPHRQLSNKHVGKPLKLVLKNGKVIYGTIKEVRNNGIVFIPVNVALLKKCKAKSKGFFPFSLFPSFFRFFRFIPFLSIFKLLLLKNR